jgi:hypothetical protein
MRFASKRTRYYRRRLRVALRFVAFLAALRFAGRRFAVALRFAALRLFAAIVGSLPEANYFGSLLNFLLPQSKNFEG